jgi:hypothetical protein
VSVIGGVTCLNDATVNGDVIVRGGSVVISGGTVDGRIDASGAEDVEVFGAKVLGSTTITGGTGTTALANNLLAGGLNLANNAATDFGLAVVANTIYRGLDCAQTVSDFGAPNALGGTKTGTCADLVTEPVKVETPVTGTVGGSVPATLALTLGAPAQFGAFTPGVTKTYTATTAANVISTAGDAALTVSDPGHLSNGAFTLPEPLQVAFSKSTWSAPVANDGVTITFTQQVKDTDALRTGTYSKTLTFTLSTTTP